MSSTTELNFLDPLYAFITLHNRAALEIINALYRPSFISALQHYKQMNRKEAEYFFDVALAAWWNTPSKPIFGDQQEVIGDILKQVVLVIAPQEIGTLEGLRPATESKTFNGLSGLFKVVVFGRMIAAGKCAELAEDANFSIAAFHQGAIEENERLREAFWLPVVIYCERRIHDTCQCIRIANSIFDEVDDRRQWFGTIADIKQYLYTSAQELCDWCLMTEKGNL